VHQWLVLLAYHGRLCLALPLTSGSGTIAARIIARPPHLVDEQRDGEARHLRLRASGVHGVIGDHWELVSVALRSKNCRRNILFCNLQRRTSKQHSHISTTISVEAHLC
jgi:hypothetical protein